MFLLELKSSELMPTNAHLTDRAIELVTRMVNRGFHGNQLLRQAIDNIKTEALSSSIEEDLALHQGALVSIPRVMIALKDQKNIWAGSCVPKALIKMTWGNPRVYEPGARPADIVFLLDKYKHDDLVHALIRVVVHGGANTLRVHDSKDWVHKIDLNRPGCIGVRCEWDPKLTEATEQDSRLWPGPIDEHLGDSNAVAGVLHEEMDFWVLERIEYFLNRMLEGPKEEAIRLLAVPIHASFLTPIRESWTRWRSQMDASPTLRRHFFRTMLSTPASSDPMGALIRVGPRTVKDCLLAATVFALAIEGAMGHRASLESFDDNVKEAPALKNMSYGNRDAYLLGLELIERQSLALRFGDIQWPRGYGLMARAEVSVEELLACERPMNKEEPQRTLITLDRQDYSHVTLLTRDIKFCSALGHGTNELRAYVEKIISEQEKHSHQALESSIVSRDQGPSLCR